MRKLTLYSMIVFTLLTLTSCEAIETIFKAGMWWGIILVVGVVVILFLIFSRGKNS
ncbi:phosphatidate cytidylyltransferase [Chryseobacterium sp. DT-3]|uniref:phosphatidate cytidylyltransferase n=1 Tax=Chryseobacterium sp. DT-3 TaxID=3396164 RepID=UPI003F1CFDAE